MFTKNVFLFLFFTSSLVSAHSHGPLSAKSISLNGSVITYINVENLRDVPQSYQLYLNDKIYGSEFKLMPKGRRKLSVIINGLSPNSIQNHIICSVSIPLKKDLFSTRICTKVKTMYPKSRLDKIKKEG